MDQLPATIQNIIDRLTDPSCDSDDLELISRSPIAQVRCLVAQHPQCSPETRAKLSQDDDISVLIAMAGSLYSPAEILIDLSNNEHIAVRQAVAANPACPHRVFSTMLRDTAPAVWKGMASNPNITSEEAIALYDRHTLSVQLALMSNPGCPIALFERVARDWIEYDRAQPEVLCTLASNPSCPAQVLNVLAYSTDLDLLTTIIYHPNCAARTMLRLKNSRYATIAQLASTAPSGIADYLWRTP